MRREDHPPCHQRLASPPSSLHTCVRTRTHMHFIKALIQPSHSSETGETRSSEWADPSPNPHKQFSNLPLLKQNGKCTVLYILFK